MVLWYPIEPIILPGEMDSQGRDFAGRESAEWSQLSAFHRLQCYGHGCPEEIKRSSERGCQQLGGNPMDLDGLGG